MALKNEREYINGPLPLDESWWTAVLEDVETLYNDKEGADNKNKSAKSNKGSREGSEFKERLPSQENELVEEINWDIVKNLYECDQVINLKVFNHNKGGLLVQGDNVQGFVPASHLIGLAGRTSRNDRDEFLSDCIGNSLKLKVIECDEERGRIVFSERAAQADPGSRLELLNNMCEGDCKQGRVTTITDFGVFVDLGGVEGLIHISELSWGRVCHPESVVSPGDEISVKILGVDREKSRVALSLKRLHPNPWDTISSRYHPGKITKAVITNVVSFGAFARLEDGLDGLIHISEFQKQGDLQEIDDVFTEGQQVEVCILTIDSAQQRLGLGLPAGDDGAS